MPYSRGPDPSPSFRFHVEVQGLQVARFSECSGLEFEQETFDYKEGGLNSRVHRLPGRFKFTNVTLKKGIATDGEPLWEWVQQTVHGPVDPKTVTVTLYDLSGESPLRAWTFIDAYPVKWSASALNAEQNAIAIETLVLAHQGMDFAQ
ncbi:MAG: phage tail protein [Chloroflexi bacterium]|nr:phage tail protein [Chloroflexota bacterium]